MLCALFHAIVGRTFQCLFMLFSERDVEDAVPYNISHIPFV